MSELHTFHVWQNGQSQGPFTVRVMQDMLKAGTLSREALVAYRGGDDWVPLSTYADVIDPPKMEVMKPPAAPVANPSAPDVPLTGTMVVEWLLRTAYVFMGLGVGAGIMGAAIMGLPGFWFCVGPFSLALTAAIFAWSRP
jgi:hypothetical protein